VIRKYRHLSGKNKISKFPQVGKMSTDSNICHTSVVYFHSQISQYQTSSTVELSVSNDTTTPQRLL